MSYARLGPTSDIYVFAGMDGRLYCHHCSRGLGDSNGLVARAMVRHLREHIAAGDKVPEKVIPEIKADALEMWAIRFWGALGSLWRRA